MVLDRAWKRRAKLIDVCKANKQAEALGDSPGEGDSSTPSVLLVYQKKLQLTISNYRQIIVRKSIMSTSWKDLIY